MKGFGSMFQYSSVVAGNDGCQTQDISPTTSLAWIHIKCAGRFLLVCTHRPRLLVDPAGHSPSILIPEEIFGATRSLIFSLCPPGHEVNPRALRVRRDTTFASSWLRILLTVPNLYPHLPSHYHQKAKSKTTGLHVDPCSHQAIVPKNRFRRLHQLLLQSSVSAVCSMVLRSTSAPNA